MIIMWQWFGEEVILTAVPTLVLDTTVKIMGQGQKKSLQI